MSATAVPHRRGVDGKCDWRCLACEYEAQDKRARELYPYEVQHVTDEGWIFEKPERYSLDGAMELARRLAADPIVTQVTIKKAAADGGSPLTALPPKEDQLPHCVAEHPADLRTHDRPCIERGPHSLHRDSAGRTWPADGEGES